MKPLSFIDSILNSITMYRLVLYSLIIMAVFALLGSLTGSLSFTPQNLIISAATLLAVSYVSNILFAKLFRAATNAESALVTALILFFILAPASNQVEVGTLAIASILAMGSKYIFALRKKHIFNPAAISAFLLGIAGNGMAIWWVATPILLPFTAIFGLLIVRKIHRSALFLSFVAGSFITILIFGLMQQLALKDLIVQIFTSWPLMFFGTFMLTEPLTTPPTRKLQIIYGAIVGLLFGSQFHIGPIFSTPELALLIGNIYSFIVSPKERLVLTLKAKNLIAQDLYEFVFTPDQKMKFKAGQYLEWTMPNCRIDSRGNRRYFTIASAPTEEDIKLGVKIPKPSSSFKDSLTSLKIGDHIYASQLGGDFTLPEDISQKLVFIAGGIGVTPFRSMIQNMINLNQSRDITMFYTNASPSEFAYNEIFAKAAPLGLKTIQVLTKEENAPKDWAGKKGHITKEMIEEIPEFKTRRYYLSGPNAMVNAYEHLLLRLQIPHGNIVKDYFPGF